MTTTIHTEAELHSLLDAVRSGDTITTETLHNYSHSTVRITTTGTAHVSGRYVGVGYTTLRTLDARIVAPITAASVTAREEVTIPRSDEAAMHALLDGLTNSDMLTVEYRDGDKQTICTGPTDGSIDSVTVRHAVGGVMVRWGERELHPFLHSITATREVTKRWERGEGDG